MPTTIKLTGQPSGPTNDRCVHDDSRLLTENMERWDPPYNLGGRAPEIKFSSFFKMRKEQHFLSPVTSFGNGFVIGFIRAFQQGLLLRLTPDDVWLAILTQFRLYYQTYAQAASRLCVRPDDVGQRATIRISRNVMAGSTTDDTAVTCWINQLTQVLCGIISSFNPDKYVNDKRGFWARACLFDGIDSGLDRQTMTGWITAFCFWSRGGCLNVKHDVLAQFGKQSGPELFREDVPYGTPFSNRQKLVLDGAEFHHIFPASIPHAVASLLINLVWRNDEEEEVTIIAGSVGATVINRKEKRR